MPTESPTEAPTTLSPTTTGEPSTAPTHPPTEYPSFEPTHTPSEYPTEHPTATPTQSPTFEPTVTPTEVPTEMPTLEHVWGTEAPVVDVTSSPRRRGSSITASPIDEIMADTLAPTLPWERSTLAPHAGPCTPAGHLHLDFGGDIANFGDPEQAALASKIGAALNLKLSELQITRHMADEANLHYGALGGGKIWHPTKVNLNINFVGVKAIELGHQLETLWLTGQFQPLPSFPLLRIEIEEIYCTEAPIVTAQPSVPITTASPTEGPTSSPTQSPTEAPTTVSPTTTNEPSSAPTLPPTEAPTFQPTLTPTETPSFEPSAMPSTRLPTDLPTTEPSRSPTGCLVRAAKMHVLFKEDVTASGRRRLLAAVTKDLSKDAFPQSAILRAAIASELRLPEAELAVKTFKLPSGVIHTELMFKGLDAIDLGYTLEAKVMANQFNPIPSYPVRRLYMEEIFDCGKHAAGATHSTDTNADTFAVPDSGFIHH